MVLYSSNWKVKLEWIMSINFVNTAMIQANKWFPLIEDMVDMAAARKTKLYSFLVATVGYFFNRFLVKKDIYEYSIRSHFSRISRRGSHLSGCESCLSRCGSSLARNKMQLVTYILPVLYTDAIQRLSSVYINISYGRIVCSFKVRGVRF